MQARRTHRTRGGLTLGAVAVLATFVLAGCGSSDSDGATSTTKPDAGSKASTTTTEVAGSGELDGMRFAATDVTGYEPAGDTNLTLAFDDGQLSVNAGCNTLGSAYELADGTLTWTGEPRATMMACPEDLQAQDTWLTDLFTAGVTAELDGGTLTLTSDDVTITLEEVADAPLTATAWSLDGTIENEAVSSLPADAKAPTLTIGEDGTAQIFTGCNTGSTTVEIAETTLTFAPMAMTRMACEADATALEQAVTTVLDGEATFTIDGETLTIMNGTAGLTYRAG